MLAVRYRASTSLPYSKCSVNRSGCSWIRVAPPVSLVAEYNDGSLGDSGTALAIGNTRMRERKAYFASAPNRRFSAKYLARWFSLFESRSSRRLNTSVIDVCCARNKHMVLYGCLRGGWDRYINFIVLMRMRMKWSRIRLWAEARSRKQDDLF